LKTRAGPICSEHGCCEHGNEPYTFIKIGFFLDQMIGYFIFSKKLSHVVSYKTPFQHFRCIC
jgi:hypothetical protein